MHRLAFLSVWVLVFTIPWQNAVTFARIGTVSQLVGVVALAFGVGATLRRGGLTFKPPPLFLLIMGVFCLWALASVFWSVAPDATVRKVVTLAQLLTFVWLVWEVVGSERQRAALAQAYILGGYVAIASTVASFLSRASVSEWRYRVAAEGTNPNWLAIGLAVGIPLAWYLFLDRPNSPLRLIHLAYIPLALAAITLAASRGGMLAAAVALAGIPFTFPRLDDRGRALSLAVLATTYFLVTSYLLPQQPDLERNVERLTSTASEITLGDLGNRTEIWQAGARVFAEHPLIGVGFDGFGAATEQQLARKRDPHSTFLSVLVDTGLVGFTLFIAAILAAVGPALRPGPTTQTVDLFLFATLMVGLIPASWEVHKVTWFVLAWLTTGGAVVLLPSPRGPPVRSVDFLPLIGAKPGDGNATP